MQHIVHPLVPSELRTSEVQYIQCLHNMHVYAVQLFFFNFVRFQKPYFFFSKFVSPYPNVQY